MRTVGVRELKAHLSRVLREVQSGETVLVTDRGRVIAELRQPGLASSNLSPVEQKLAELAAKGKLKLAEKPWVGYTPSPVEVPPGTLQAMIDDMRDER
ncbi:type II toxin-antitoxin system Phd/YefM family antitoxin [Gemmatimonas sp.]|jgi:antitoxin (DNA-binding transcriptional repressor) of toxin-antitoxin stability system|uniref:type II toxin-antitoxin system Phd/YefM family antitoxin n=1 Tax=Gemmatimonas sp. TaxID=1962908 RepID=UPI0037C02AFD